LVAKAVATECGLPFLSVKGPELLGSYVGESEANVRKVFSSAREAASTNLPIAAAILFFDELDSLAPRRGGMDHGGGVMERVVASLLAELDVPNSAGSKDGPQGRVFVLGATNRPDLLDPSLLRPGRLDRLVYLGIATDHNERTRVLVSQLRKMKLDGDATEMASAIVKTLLPRLSGADFSKLSSGAMLNAVHRLCHRAEEERKRLEEDGKKSVTIDHILSSWGEEQCTPVITMEDLQQASREVAPSVTEEEMERYERLRSVHDTKQKQ
jgi:peroxin-6